MVGFKPLSNIWGFKWILASGYLFHSHGIDGPFIVDFPIDSMVIFHSLYFYQRVHAVWLMSSGILTFFIRDGAGTMLGILFSSSMTGMAGQRRPRLSQLLQILGSINLILVVGFVLLVSSTPGFAIPLGKFSRWLCGSRFILTHKFIDLVGGLEHFLFFHIFGNSNPQLNVIFFRGVGLNKSQKESVYHNFGIGFYASPTCFLRGNVAPLSGQTPKMVLSINPNCDLDIYGIILPNWRAHIFQDGYCTTNQINQHVI